MKTVRKNSIELTCEDLKTASESRTMDRQEHSFHANFLSEIPVTISDETSDKTLPQDLLSQSNFLIVGNIIGLHIADMKFRLY